MKPMVTIGVCARNCESCIGETIESILGQNFPHENMEVIFVDDGSEDRTLSIIKDYIPKMDMQVKVFHQGWRGLGHGRNVVTSNAQGDFILWVDGDMVLSSDYLDKLLKFMGRHPEVGITKGEQALEPGGNTLATLEAYSRAAGRMIDYSSKKADLKSLGTGGAIYRIEAVREAGGFDEKIRGYGEDLDLEIRVRRNGWSLQTANTKFRDYEKRPLTWKNLWTRYWLRGYQTHYLLHKNKSLIRHYKMFPPAAFVSGLLYAITLYKHTQSKLVFLLPLEHVFKMSAWYVGFAKSHRTHYEYS
jgi:glycosyltransferase involved in cell wall biosynthesis